MPRPRSHSVSSVTSCSNSSFLFNSAFGALGAPKIRSGLFRRGQHVLDWMDRLSGTGHAGTTSSRSNLSHLNQQEIRDLWQQVLLDGTPHFVRSRRASPLAKAHGHQQLDAAANALNPVRTLFAVGNKVMDRRGRRIGTGHVGTKSITIELVPP